MMKSIKLIFLFVVICISAIAQNITIKGVAQHYLNEEISAWTLNDYISQTEKQLTFSAIDSTGNFTLQLNTKEIQYITLKIEKNIASMYIEPDGNYEIIIYPPDSSTYQNPNVEHDVKLSIKLKSKTEINALTIDYDKRFDDFLTKEYPAFVKRFPQPKIDSFKLAMHTYYEPVSNPYFKAYINYTIAALQEKTKMSEKKLYAAYFANQPILYNHKEYMDFFNTFYKKRLQSFSQTKQAGNIVSQINEHRSLKGTMEAFKADKYLLNDTIRELVLIKGLYESYFDRTFKRESILSLLDQILTETTLAEHKRIVQNIFNSFSKLQPGVSAPFFELPDKMGRTHSLDELRAKKHIYLMFFDDDCTSCLQQMKVIPALKKEYGSKIDFIAISTDKTNTALANFCAKNPKFDWQFLYDNSEGKLKSTYEIKALPTYFLIGPDGKFVQVPAESPEGDIERIFFDITKPQSKQHNIGKKANH